MNSETVRRWCVRISWVGVGVLAWLSASVADHSWFTTRAPGTTPATGVSLTSGGATVVWVGVLCAIGASLFFGGFMRRIAAGGVVLAGALMVLWGFTVTGPVNDELSMDGGRAAAEPIRTGWPVTYAAIGAAMLLLALVPLLWGGRSQRVSAAGWRVVPRGADRTQP